MLRRLWAWLTSRDKVRDKWGCPECGERRVDRLVWTEGGAAVWCERCGTVHVP